MADPTRARAAVALPLPRIPPWTAPTPEAKAKAAEAQRRREEGTKEKKAVGVGGEGPQGMQNGIGGVVMETIRGKKGGDAEGENENRNGVGAGNVSQGGSVGGAIEEKLAGLVGSRVKITNILGKSYTGSVYTSSSDELVLSTGAMEYHLIPISKIRGYEVLEQEVLKGKTSTPDREKKREEKDKKPVKPEGVSAVGWSLFLVLQKTLPVRWNDKKIVVLDNVTIEPPYDAEDCKAPPKHGKQLERVKELVRKEREKVAGRRGG